jgi:hypothetical protein
LAQPKIATDSRKEKNNFNSALGAWLSSMKKTQSSFQSLKCALTFLIWLCTTHLLLTLSVYLPPPFSFICMTVLDPLSIVGSVLGTLKLRYNGHS